MRERNVSRRSFVAGTAAATAAACLGTGALPCAKALADNVDLPENG